MSGLDYLMRQTNERESVEGHADLASEVESRNGRTHIPSLSGQRNQMARQCLLASDVSRPV